MQPAAFKIILENLTGTAVKDLGSNAEEFLAGALADDSRELDASQFNELMLLANKNRVEAAFFRFFFCAKGTTTCTVSDLPAGVTTFQRFALLTFGNFIFAFRTLSRIGEDEALQTELGAFCRDPAEIDRELGDRPQKVLNISPIPRDQTFLVGYLSTREISADLERAKWLEAHVDANDSGGHHLLGVARSADVDDVQRQELIRVVEALQLREGVVPKLIEHARHQLVARDAEMRKVQSIGQRNTDVYLSWDYMDVYFATSMRKRWEYEDLHQFVTALMGRAPLSGMGLRYFDPTQSYDANRVGKGLVEALMLKRAACTVYSVQDADTLGKDSELAATLAQGKPVIAYAPEVDPVARAKELAKQPPTDLRDRLRFLLHAEQATGAPALRPAITAFLLATEDYEAKLPWRAIPDQGLLAAFQTQYADVVRDICELIASAEKRIADGRARTLKDAHPLGIQVNLDTGVANGVLVVRGIDDCAQLIYRVITNRMEFDVVDEPKLDAWILRERISGCIYRVVTRNHKLSNCFWNFYRNPSRN